MLKPQTPQETQLVASLARRYRRESIAFWGAIATDLRNDIIDALIAAGITDLTQIKIEVHRPRPLDPGKLLGYARAHARVRRLSFLNPIGAK